MNKKTGEWLSEFRSGKRFGQEKNRRALVVSITSGKGGVGKTSTALKMGLELANLNFKVLLIDCDYNLSNTLVKLGVPLNDDFYGLIKSYKSFSDCLYKRGNFHLLPGCNGSLHLFEENFFLDKWIFDLIDEQQDNYDYILLDCPAGLSETMLNINAFCDQRLFILTPDKSSLTDSYSLIKILKMKYGVRTNHLIVNRVISPKQFKRVSNSLQQTAQAFLGCEILTIGGIKEYENKLESFDETLLHNSNSVLHKNFTKVIKFYSEEHGKHH